MFTNEDEFRDIVEKLEIDDAPRGQHQADLRRAVLAAFDDAGAEGAPPQDGGESRRRWRMVMHRRSLQIGAVAAAAACVAIAVLWVFGPGAEVALAQVRERVELARTVCYKLTSYHNNRQENSADVMCMEPGKMRTVWPGMVSILDWEQGEILTLVAEGKQAHSVAVTDMKNLYHRNWLADLKANMRSGTATELERRDIAGRPAKGWRTMDGGWTCTIWADATTGELLEVEWEHGGNRMVMSGFVLDEALEASLFSMTPPDGYTLMTETAMSQADASEADILILLRAWASGNAGRFPDKLDPARFAADAAKADWYGDVGIDSEAKAQAARESISRAFFLLHSWNVEWQYVGQGVERGQADQPVLWYRPVGSETYRVIYGDFHVGELSLEQVKALQASADGTNP